MVSSKWRVNTVVGEQPYKNRDMVGSDSGLGHLLVSLIELHRSFVKHINYLIMREIGMSPTQK